MVRTSYAGVGHGSPRSLSPICGVTGSSVNVRREGILDAQALPVGSTVALLHMFHPADGAKKGKIVVEFASLEDLERIIKTMAPDEDTPLNGS